jgi:uncharacterized protein
VTLFLTTACNLRCDYCYAAAGDTPLERMPYATARRAIVSACYEVFSEKQPQADTFFYGRPDDAEGYRFDDAAVERLRGQADRHHEFCQGCFAKWSCAGDCYHKALDVGGGAFRGSDRCHITRELTKDQILAAIARSGGVVWADGPDPEDQS